MAWREFTNLETWCQLQAQAQPMDSPRRKFTSYKLHDIEKMGICFAQSADTLDPTWVKGSVYQLRGLAFSYLCSRSKDDDTLHTLKLLQLAKKLADDILTRHYSDLPLCKSKFHDQADTEWIVIRPTPRPSML
jgi:hypothetical protein